jgi:hypothetical protein
VGGFDGLAQFRAAGIDRQEAKINNKNGTCLPRVGTLFGITKITDELRNPNGDLLNTEQLAQSLMRFLMEVRFAVEGRSASCTSGCLLVALQTICNQQKTFSKRDELFVLVNC